MAGGQSGGPAVAVAAGMALGALASDLGGSLRVPAAFTGTVGFKPSRGRLSKAGLITLSSRFDDPGFVTRAVADAALLTALLQGEVPLPLILSPPVLKSVFLRDSKALFLKIWGSSGQTLTREGI